jgi:ribosomal-protein-alanine N-acetyltransferase
VIETERLLLRRWRDEDDEPFAAINSDPEIAYWLGGPAFAANPAQVERYNASIDEHGFGRFAVERLGDGALIGAVGPMPIFAGLPVSGFEIGWRIVRSAWGKGYATEAARAAMDRAFSLGVEEMLAFTAESNVRSQAVMGHLGLVRDASRDFDHPKLEEGDPLRRHTVYALTRP